MIESILSFSLKSSMCSAIFAAYYMLALKNVQINGFNRTYLLAAALLSLLLPFARFEIFSAGPVAVPDFPVFDISAKGAEEVFINTGAAPGRFNWPLALTAAYFAVSVVMVVKLAAKFTWVYYLKTKGQRIKREGFLLIKTGDSRAPFSFMNMIFWPVHMRQDSTEGKRIFMHEMAHVKQYHTLDKIFMQLILAICWLNPFNWLIKKEVWLQHEFLADRYAIKDGDSETFARMLLYNITNPSGRTVISPFFQSPVKRRLLMLTQRGGNTYGFLRRFLSIPILFTTILLMSANTEKQANALRSPKKIVLVLDAAHGGKDVGGKSIYGHREKDITLAVCRKLVSLSGEYNIEIINTRSEDVYTTLQERLDISNSTRADIFLSVHVNKSTAADAAGNSYELGVNPQSRHYNKSILLASSIASKLKIQKLPAKVVDQGNVFVIRENRHPALLIECGNLDDAGNMALLRDEARTEILCRNILSGIVDYSTRLATE